MLFGSFLEVRAFTNKYVAEKQNENRKRKGSRKDPSRSGPVLTLQEQYRKKKAKITPLRGERKQQNTDTLQFTADVAKTTLAGSAAVEEIFDMFVSHELIQHFFYSRLPTMPG